MIAGRLRWKAQGAKPPGRSRPRRVRLPDAARCSLTEAGTKKRATLHVVRGEAALAAHDPGGLEPLECSRCRRVRRRAAPREPHAEARAHRPAPASPASATPTPTRSCTARGSRRSQLTRSLDDAELARLFEATRATLTRVDRAPAPADAARRFPEKVTAFRPEMAVHGRYGEPCPVCGAAGAAHRARRERDATTARAARPAAGCSPTARSRGCSSRTGRARSRSWRSGAALAQPPSTVSRSASSSRTSRKPAL